MDDFTKKLNAVLTEAYHNALLAEETKTDVAFVKEALEAEGLL